jgi:hypothetical protein
MSNQPVKNFFSKVFGSKEKSSVSFDCSVKNGIGKIDKQENIEKKPALIMEDLPSFKETIRILMTHPRRMSKLDKIHARIIEISDFTATTAFADMVVNRPAEVQKLRDELDALVIAANNV